MNRPFIKRKLNLACITAAVVFTVSLTCITVRTTSSSERNNQAVSTNLLGRLQQDRVTLFRIWEVDDGPGGKLFCVARAVHGNPTDSPEVILTISNEDGAVLYKEECTDVTRLYPVYALRNGSAQLAVELNYGGSASFFQLLSYQDGAIVDLLGSEDTDFTISAEVRPVLRSGVNPAKTPFEIFLTSGVGLASSVEKHTDVYRFSNGAYKHSGRFATRQVEDYKERILKKARP